MPQKSVHYELAAEAAVLLAAVIIGNHHAGLRKTKAQSERIARLAGAHNLPTDAQLSYKACAG